MFSLLKNVLMLLLTAIAMTCFSDRIQPNSVWCLGEIKELKQVKRNDWHISMSNVTPLMYGENFENNTADSETNSITELSLLLASGLGGVMVFPCPEWSGQTALFIACKMDNKYVVPDMYLSLSPTSYPFCVLENKKESIPLIKKVIASSKIIEYEKKCNSLSDIISSAENPFYIKMYALEQIALAGVDKTTLIVNKASSSILLKFRDSKQLDPRVRYYADSLLMSYSFSEYQWSTDRISFLEKMLEMPDIESQLKGQFITTLKRAKQRLAENEEKK